MYLRYYFFIEIFTIQCIAFCFSKNLFDLTVLLFFLLYKNKTASVKDCNLGWVT